MKTLELSFDEVREIVRRAIVTWPERDLESERQVELAIETAFDQGDVVFAFSLLQVLQARVARDIYACAGALVDYTAARRAGGGTL